MPSQCTGSGGKCWTCCGPSSLSLDAETPISESQQRKDAAGQLQLLTRNDASRREGTLWGRGEEGNEKEEDWRECEGIELTSLPGPVNAAATARPPQPRGL